MLISSLREVIKMKINEYFNQNGWKIVDVLTIPSKNSEQFSCVNMNLSEPSNNFLKNTVSNKIYLHQKMALEKFINGKNICLTTGTASGKSLVFYLAAIEMLAKNPNARIIAIYPLKALGKEQEERWIKAMKNAGINVNIGRIDGQVPLNKRNEILKNSNVLVITPDVFHAWFMYNLNDKAKMRFLSMLSLIIVDEVHNYTGVFGSNCALLFRRIQHILNLLKVSPQYIGASATMANPELHLNKLFGLEFDVIGFEHDTSPKFELDIKLVQPPNTKDLLTTLSDLFEVIAQKTDHKFIVFVDSRKQTEYITSIISRNQIRDEDELINYDRLKKLIILPYRAGYEEHDRSVIQERLSSGSVKGVVSTSALELGIDIPFLTLGILVGVPKSSTSFFQRIGRIGRHTKGEVIVVNNGDIYSENIFRNPKELLKLPLSEGALYLENPRIQYIHALCLSRQGGEHDQICSLLNIEESSNISTNVEWPEKFIELCKSERIGVIPSELQNIKLQAGDDPNHAYPLRDVDVQFKVEKKSGPNLENLGSLSHGQLMREAYPGAVYYYATQPYRVYRIIMHSKLVEVRNEKRYTTKPIMIPTLVFPNFTPGNLHKSIIYDKLLITECNLQIRETTIGIKERRGPNEISFNYPFNSETNIYFNQSRFTRNYFTTGIVITHPILNNSQVRCDLLANLIFEVFLMLVPYERRDINFASDKHRIKVNRINEGDKFICIYDQTYGSLRLSGRILEEDLLKIVIEKSIELAKQDKTLDINQSTFNALEKMYVSLTKSPKELSFDSGNDKTLDNNSSVRIIMPNSKGIDIRKNNEEFFVESIFYSPNLKGLAYRGKHLSEQTDHFSNTVISIPIEFLKEVPGESKLGTYDIETGELKEIE